MRFVDGRSDQPDPTTHQEFSSGVQAIVLSGVGSSTEPGGTHTMKPRRALVRRTRHLFRMYRCAIGLTTDVQRVPTTSVSEVHMRSRISSTRIPVL
jgi:hypothetical protein